MTGFGLAFIKKEGGPIHPDDPVFSVQDVSDEVYLAQLTRFVKEHGLEITQQTYCSRPHLLKIIEEEIQK